MEWGKEIFQPLSPPALWFLIGASYWLNPTGNQKAKKPIDAVLRDQPPRDLSRAEKGREWICWGEGTYRK